MYLMVECRGKDTLKDIALVVNFSCFWSAGFSLLFFKVWKWLSLRIWCVVGLVVDGAGL